MPHYSPKHHPGIDVTYVASVPIVGGQLVVVSGVNSVAPVAGSNPAWIGVARQDAPAGENVVVTRSGVQRLVTAGPVTAADRVTGAATGKVVTGATNVVGTALTSVTTGGLLLVVLDR